MSSLAHNGIGVPQYRLREMFQSRAAFNHPPNLPSPTLAGTLHVSITYEKVPIDLPSGLLVVRNKLVRQVRDSNEPSRDSSVDEWSTGSAVRQRAVSYEMGLASNRMGNCVGYQIER